MGVVPTSAFAVNLTLLRYHRHPISYLSGIQLVKGFHATHTPGQLRIYGAPFLQSLNRGIEFLGTAPSRVASASKGRKRQQEELVWQALVEGAC